MNEDREGSFSHRLSVHSSSFSSEMASSSPSFTDVNRSTVVNQDEYVFEQEAETDNANTDINFFSDAPTKQKYSVDVGVWVRAPGRL
jgi:hypothetical protein